MADYTITANFATNQVQPTFNRGDLVWTQIASAQDYLLGAVPWVSTMGAAGFGLAVFFDKNIHDPETPNDNALNQTYDGARVIAVSTTPSTWLGQIEDAVSAADLLMSMQLGGFPPGNQPSKSGKPAEHPYGVNVPAGGAFVRAWRHPSNHRRPVQWVTGNEFEHATADSGRYQGINADPIYPTETQASYQQRRRHQKQLALDKTAQIHALWFPPGTDGYGPWDSIVTGSFLQSSTHYNAPQKLMPEGRNFMTAWVDKLRGLVSAGAMRNPDAIGFTIYNGKFAVAAGLLGAIPFLRTLLGAGGWLARLIQYAPSSIKRGADEDDDGNPDSTANKMTAACEMLIDLEWLGAQPDVAVVGCSYPVGNARHSMIVTADGVTYSLGNRGKAVQMRSWVPPRRAKVTGATTVDGSPGASKVYSWAGWSSARAVVMLVNNSVTLTKTVALTVSNLPSTITGRTFTRTLYVLTEGSATPASSTWDGSSDISLPPESVTALVIQVTGGPDVSARRYPLSDGTYVPVFQRVEPFNGRPGADFAWLDQQRGVAMLYASGSLPEVSCAGVWANLPDVLYATLFLWRNAGSGVYLGVDIEVPDVAVVRAVSRLAGAVVNGEVQTINIAALVGARWPTASRTARVRVWLSNAGAGMGAEVWLSGTSSSAAAVNG